MYWSWKSICSDTLSPTDLGFLWLNSETKIEKSDSFPSLEEKWLQGIQRGRSSSGPGAKRMDGEVQGSDRSKVGFLFLVWDVELII